MLQRFRPRTGLRTANATLARLSGLINRELKQKGQIMMATFLKHRVGSDATDSRLAEGAFLVAACVVPAIICFWLLTLQLTTWQWVISLVATAALGFQLLLLSLLCRLLRGRR